MGFRKIGLWIATALGATGLLLGSAGCGGQSGGLPAGLGGAIANARLSTNVVTLNVGDDFSTIRDGAIAAAGSDSVGAAAKSFEIILKGAGVEGGDVRLAFDLAARSSANPTGALNDGQQLYDAYDAANNPIKKLATDVKPITVFEDGATFRNANTGEVVAADPTNTRAKALFIYRYINSNNVALRTSGKYDVIVNFYSVTKDLQDSPNRAPVPQPPFWRVLFEGQAEIKDNVLYLAQPLVSGGDPTLLYAKAAKVTTTVTNLAPNAKSVKVRLVEKNLDDLGSTKVIFEQIYPITSGAASQNFDLTVVNRLRGFTTEVQSFLDSNADTPSIASGLDTTPIAIGVNQTAVTGQSVAVATRVVVGSLATSPLTVVFGGSSASFKVSAKLKQILSSEPVADQNFEIPNSYLTFGSPFTKPGNVPSTLISGSAGTYSAASSVDLLAQVYVGIDLQTTATDTASAEGEVRLPTLGLGFQVAASSVPPRAGSVIVTVSETGAGDRSYPKTLVAPFSDLQSVAVVDRGYEFNAIGIAYSGPGGSGVPLSTTPAATFAASSATVAFDPTLNRVTELTKVNAGTAELATVKVKRGDRIPLDAFVNLQNPAGVDVKLEPSNFRFETGSLNVASIGAATGGAPLVAGVVQADQSRVSVDANGVLTIGNSVPSSKTERTVLLAIAYERAANEYAPGVLNGFSDYTPANLPKRVKFIRITILPNLGSGTGGIG
ncbi:MAG: hypothetical protein ACOYON_08535 [Fimbriimonas sp.]